LPDDLPILRLSNEKFESMVQQLEQRTADATLSHAIFVDPALGDPFHDLRQSLAKQTFILSVPEDKVPVNVRPYLLIILPGPAGAELRVRSLALAHTEALGLAETKGARSICGWISFTGEPEPLVNALTQKATLILDETQTLLFRFYDPRVITHLRRLLRPAQFFNGLPVLRSWTYVSPGIDLEVFAPEGEMESPAPVWFMTRQQRDGVARIEAVNCVLSESPVDATHAPAIDAALLRAQQLYGWTDLVEMVAFGVVSIRCHTAFDSHPEIAARLSELKRGGESFAGWASTIDESEWRRIAAEIDKNNAQEL
jgi:Domain of unknown function (DUF4123)